MLWYIGQNENDVSIGPYQSRADAIKAGRDLYADFYIKDSTGKVERAPPLKLVYVRSAARTKLDAMVDVFAPDIQSAFLASIKDVTDNAIIKDVVRNIEMGDVDGAFRALGYSDAAMRPLTAAIERAYETGGVMTGKTFPAYLNTPSGRIVFRFDVRNSRAEAYLRDKSSTLVTRIGDDIRVNVRTALTDGVAAGRNPRNIALDLVGRIDATGKRSGGIIGLTTQQEYWARGAQKKLEQLDASYFKLGMRDARFDKTVAAAIESGKKLDPDTIEKLVTRYKDKALKHRGDMVGRTEAMQALNASEYEATLQTVDIGATKADAIQREWDSVGDNDVRYSHRRLNGQRVGLYDAFKTIRGARLMHPGDASLGAPADEIIACRCRVRTIVDWLAGVV